MEMQVFMKEMNSKNIKTFVDTVDLGYYPMLVIENTKRPWCFIKLLSLNR